MFEPSEGAILAALSQLGPTAVAAGIPPLRSNVPANDWRQNFLATTFGPPGVLLDAIRAHAQYRTGVEESAWSTDIIEIVKDLTALGHHASFLQWLVLEHASLLADRCEAYLAAEPSWLGPWVRPATLPGASPDPTFVRNLAVRYLRFRIEPLTRDAIRESMPANDLASWRSEQHFSLGMGVRNLLREAEFGEELLAASFDVIWADLLREAVSPAERPSDQYHRPHIEVCRTCNLVGARDEIRIIEKMAASLADGNKDPHARSYVSELGAFDADPRASSAAALLTVAPHLRLTFERFTPEGEPLQRLEERLLRSGMGASQAVEPMIVAGSIKELHLRQFFLRSEFLYFVLHLTSRVSYAKLGMFVRDEIAKNLERVVPHAFVEGLIGHWPEERKRGVLAELFENLNRAEGDYGGLALTLDGDMATLRTDEESVLHAFVQNVAAAIGESADPVVQNRILQIGIALWSDLQLPVLVARVGSSSRIKQRSDSRN